MRVITALLGSVSYQVDSMDAYSTESSFSYSDPPPVLVAGSTAGAIERARDTVSAFGCRIGAVLNLADAAERVQLQGSASALWLELDEIDGELPARLFSLINSD